MGERPERRAAGSQPGQITRQGDGERGEAPHDGCSLGGGNPMRGSRTDEKEPTKRSPGSGQAHHAAQVRGVLAERVVISTALDPFLPLKALATYSGLCVRTLRSHLEDAGHPLPCYRIGGKYLVRRSDYDTWALTYRRVGSPDVDRIVADVLKELDTAKHLGV